MESGNHRGHIHQGVALFVSKRSLGSCLVTPFVEEKAWQSEMGKRARIREGIGSEQKNLMRERWRNEIGKEQFRQRSKELNLRKQYLLERRPSP